MSTVDVVIPCYNYAHYLRGCVDSVLSQSGVDVRALVIDDASSDETAQTGYELAGSDPRVEFHRHHKNKGHIATYNEGLAMVSADFVVLLSADDLRRRVRTGPILNLIAASAPATTRSPHWRA